MSPTVRLMDPQRRLELEANAGRLGSARVSIVLLPWGDDSTVIIVDEHPLTGSGCSSHTTTCQPASARTLAATSPFGPAPMTTTSDVPALLLPTMPMGYPIQCPST